MARTGKKIILLPVTNPQEIEDVTVYLERRNKGLRYHVSYIHNRGLELTLYGPDDKIKLLEFEILQFIENLDN